MDKVQVSQQIGLVLYLVLAPSYIVDILKSAEATKTKHVQMDEIRTFRENQTSCERVLDQPTNNVYSSMLMLM